MFVCLNILHTTVPYAFSTVKCQGSRLPGDVMRWTGLGLLFPFASRIMTLSAAAAFVRQTNDKQLFVGNTVFPYWPCWHFVVIAWSCRKMRFVTRLQCVWVFVFPLLTTQILSALCLRVVTI